MILCSIALFIWPEVIIKIFNTEPGLVKMAGIFVRIGVVGFLMLGFGPVLGLLLLSRWQDAAMCSSRAMP